jgi:hypothetical protein
MDSIMIAICVVETHPFVIDPIILGGTMIGSVCAWELGKSKNGFKNKI